MGAVICFLLDCFYLMKFYWTSFNILINSYVILSVFIESHLGTIFY